MIAAIGLLALGLVLIALIIVANGYFVAQEFAYMSVDRSRLHAQADAGDAAAARALKVTRRTSFMLSGAQLGITVTGLLVGYVAEPLVGEALGTLLGGVGIPAALSISVGTVLALALATGVQMVVGELYPKNLALAIPEPMAKALARTTLIYLAVFGWLIVVFDAAANGLLRLLRIEPVHDVDSTATAEDLDRIVADSRDSGDLPEDLSMLIDRVLDFPHETVEHAMIPWTQVGTVDESATIGEARTLMASGHTRYPVISPDQQPVGVVHLTDLLDPAVRTGDPVTSIMREPLLLPTLMPLPDAMETLSSSRHQLACVLDEFGGFDGVITREDLAEELVGELTDEHDLEPPRLIVAEQDDVWRMAGDVHVDELERTVGHDLPEGDYETVSGLVIAELGDFPEAGQSVLVDLPADPRELAAGEAIPRRLQIDVTALTRHVPSELLVRLVHADGTDDHPAKEDR
ncbi:hemolysin family protein [Brachybacterium sp. YJGR34]|uniref:hemolysin family protein n=1 Tax=Brachybacterium sp. YJGR34 TaxID=2059911 RepID=UPI000E0C43BE|nr:hemolysin family protein [Brachybacterium sp. YJGR34]